MSKKNSDVIYASPNRLINDFRGGLMITTMTPRRWRNPFRAAPAAPARSWAPSIPSSAWPRRWGLQDLWAAGGMPEMLGVTLALKVAGLKETALVTDGRFSGATCGPCVGHVCPEASDGGLIALIEDGDTIEIDILNGHLHADVDEDEIARRKDKWQPVLKDVGFGYMDRYRRHVRPASDGAILD